jgi:phenylacetate-CoA ligase
MAIDDSLHPLLGLYFSSPDWVRNSLGKAYSLVPHTLTRGARYQAFLQQAALQDGPALKAMASQKLATTLRNALESVPAYRPWRHLVDALDTPWHVLRHLPLTSKDDIKRSPEAWLSTRMPAARRLATATGGSTSTPMQFYLHKGVTRAREYAYMQRFHERAGMGARDLVLAMRGRTIRSARDPGGRVWMMEPIKRQLILSSDFLERATMPQYMDAIRAHRPCFIQAYPSTVYALARWLQENPAPDITSRIRGVMLYSENVLEHHMTLLREVFDCPVLKHYGHSERILMAASMPDDARMFFWPQYGHMELIDETGNTITQPGVLGELVGTSFDNEVMPFVRYRTGDMAVLDDRPHPLLPGFPVARSIEGRRQEYVVCRDQRLIAVCGMGSAHSSDLSVVDSMQFEQKEPGHLIIKVVAPHRLPDDACKRIVQAMQNKTQGGCTAELVQVDAIPRTLRGKHQLLIQHLDIGRYLGAPLQ